MLRKEDTNLTSQVNAPFNLNSHSQLIQSSYCCHEWLMSQVSYAVVCILLLVICYLPLTISTRERVALKSCSIYNYLQPVLFA